MITWIEFENEYLKNDIYSINNESNKNIILFGNCTIAPIGFFLNELLNKKYNIHIVISWLYEFKGFEKFNMQLVNNKIIKLLNIADVFIYHNHNKDYGINATNIVNFCNKNTFITLIPNFHFCFDAPSTQLFQESLRKLKTNITIRSHYQEFEFITDHYKTIRFFNTSLHPTHYLLFLMAKSIKFKIMKEPKIIDFQSYFNEQNKLQFKKIKEYVHLPGFLPYTKEIQQITGVEDNVDYFDY